MKNKIKIYWIKFLDILSGRLISELNQIISESYNESKDLFNDYNELYNSYKESLKALEGHRELNKNLQEKIFKLEIDIQESKELIRELKINDYGSRCDSVNNWLMRNHYKNVSEN